MKKYTVTAADQDRVKTILSRLVYKTLSGAELQIQPSVSIGIKSANTRETIGNVYGILPFAMSASTDQLIDAIEVLEKSKHAKTDRGDFYGAWRDRHRQRILEGVLSGMTTFNLTSLQ